MTTVSAPSLNMIYLSGPLNFPESVAVTVNTCANNLWAVIKVMDAFGKSAMVLAIATPETGMVNSD